MSKNDRKDPPGRDWERRADDWQWVTGHEYGQLWSHGPRLIVWFVVMVGILIGGWLVVAKVLAPEAEAIRRDVYEESKSYRDGTIRDLDNMRLEWSRTEDEAARKLIEGVAIHRAADFPREDLPERITTWLKEIGGVR